MDYCVSNHKTLAPRSLHRSPKSRSSDALSSGFTLSFLSNRYPLGKRAVPAFCAKFRPFSFAVVASAGASHCEFSSLNSPLEPSSSVGKLLSRVLQNHRQLFYATVTDELKLLSDDRNAAVNRMVLSSGSDEALLHRRIARMKEGECRVAVEDVMYMLVFYKFSEIKVPLVPKLSRCIYNGRLEISPAKDWELESIYKFEVLQMIREHVSSLIGLRADSSVTENWAITEIKLARLAQMYVASIIYGYFLRSASLRHHLECSLVLKKQERFGWKDSIKFHEMCLHGFKNLLFSGLDKQSVQKSEGRSLQATQQEDLRCFVMGFDSESLQRCAKFKSKEARDLVENQTQALFGIDRVNLVEREEVILTSFLSLKRLALEAVAFGSFLWDAEEYVGSVYKLSED